MDANNGSISAHKGGIGYWAVIALAVVILCVGMPIFAGGVWLVMLGGSVFYAAAGAGLFLAGFFMIRMSMAGFWFYLLTFIGTAAWTFDDVGAHGEALFQRLVVPMVILLLVLLAVPCLRRRGVAIARKRALDAGIGAVSHGAFSSRERNA
ncbi:hypothetical protein [Thalassospira mesophila]|uniref:hypothetical protein n=1 Tax=Thalassospira mesophila TaxID=1293891 RepID=UPI001B80B244|nr:hypothetical protein [Thalassospira mesophila]